MAFKITRLTGRTKLVAAQGAFHGRTMGSLALTGQPSKQAPFAPLPGDVTHVPYGDAAALAAAVDDDTAAVFLEPIMGEGGVVVPPAGYLVAAREITSTTAVRCWCSTRCRPGWAAPERSSPTSTTASLPIWSPSPRGSAVGCRSVRASPSGPPAIC